MLLLKSFTEKFIDLLVNVRILMLSHIPDFRRHSVLSVTVLMVVAVLAYLPGLNGPFLFDDVPNITENLLLVRPKNQLLDWWAAAQSSGAGALRRPIAMLSFALQIPSGPPVSAFWLKVVNLLIHLVCATLLWLLATIIGESQILRAKQAGLSSPDWLKTLPIFAASAWALNPLLLSTVLYPVQRMAQLSALFVLVGLCVYCWFRLRWAKRGASVEEVAAVALWGLLFTLLSVLCKENGVLLPWLAGVLEFGFFCGLWAGRRVLWVSLAGATAFVLPLVTAIGLLWWQWEWVVIGFEYREFTVQERLWTELRLLWSYLTAFLFPRIGIYGLFHDDLELSIGWFSPWTTLLAPLAWIAVLFSGLILRRSFSWLLAGCLFYLVGHSIESGPLALELVFEHRNYLPSVGLALVVGAALAKLQYKLRSLGSSRFLQLMPMTYIALLGLTLLVRSLSWSSELGLASAAVVRHPESARSSHFYANTLLKQHSVQSNNSSSKAQYLSMARHEFETLLQRQPGDLSAMVMLFTLDSKYFSAVSNPERWLDLIDRRIRDGVLQATEFSAVRLFVGCTLSGACEVEPDRFNGIVEAYERRVPPTVASALQLQIAAANSLAAKGRVELIQNALAKTPEDLSLYYPLVGAYIEMGDFAAAHEVLERLLAQDGSYRHLSAINALFDSRGGEP